MIEEWYWACSPRGLKCSLLVFAVFIRIIGRSIIFSYRYISIQYNTSFSCSIQFDRFNMDYDRRVMFSGSPDLEKVNLFYMKNEDFFEPDTPRTDTLLQHQLTFQMKLPLLFINQCQFQLSSNLLTHWEAAMRWLLHRNDICVLSADKNLGPVVMERSKYIHYAFKDHLIIRTYLSSPPIWNWR